MSRCAFSLSGPDLRQRCALTGGRFFAPSAMPPHLQTATEPSYRGNVIGQDKQSKRHHPETQYREEAEKAKHNQYRADCDSRSARPGHPNPAPGKGDVMMFSTGITALRSFALPHAFLGFLLVWRSCDALVASPICSEAAPNAKRQFGLCEKIAETCFAKLECLCYRLRHTLRARHSPVAQR